MDPGPPLGAAATLVVTVTEAMTARFDDEDVHPVYGTAALVQHVEQVSRRLLVDHLGPGEEGVGARIEVVHRAPVPVGDSVELVATVTAVTPRQLRTEVVARSRGREVASARFDQAVVDLAAWRSAAGLGEP